MAIAASLSSHHLPTELGGGGQQAVEEAPTGISPDVLVERVQHQLQHTHGTTMSIPLPAATATAEAVRIPMPGSEPPIQIQAPTRSGTRTKYTCACENRLWGKSGMKIRCEECDDLFVASTA